MKSYEMYIFDLDDTLINTYETVTRDHYPRLAKILGVSYPDDDVVRQYWGNDLCVSLEKIFGIPVDQRKTIAELQQLHKNDPVPPINGTHIILDVLRKHKKFIGLYSSSPPALMDTCIRSSLSRKREDFDFIFSTAEQQIAKPSPHIVYIMMERYRQLFGIEIGLDKVLLIGDSVADFLIAKNARVDFAAVLTGPTTQADFIDVGLDPQRIFPSIKEALTPPSDHGVVAIIKDEQNRFLFIKESRPGHRYKDHWSGPHGVCEVEDILEEETVVRETQEECGVAVKPLRKLYTRHADTKVRTVSFWETELLITDKVTFNASNREVGAIAWFSLNDIVSGRIPLYPGTKDFFSKYKQREEGKNE